MRRPGRYGCRLLVVLAITASVTGVGYLWRSSALASIVADGGPGARDGFIRDGAGSGGRGATAFSLGNIDDLIGTIVIGVAVLGVVIVIDKARRHRRPIRMSVRSGAVGHRSEDHDGSGPNGDLCALGRSSAEPAGARALRCNRW